MSVALVTIYYQKPAFREFYLQNASLFSCMVPPLLWFRSVFNKNFNYATDTKMIVPSEVQTVETNTTLNNSESPATKNSVSILDHFINSN